MMPLISLMLTHLVKQRNDAEDGKSKQTYHAQGNGPSCPIIQGFYKHHKTQNGQQNGRNKEWNLHIEGDFFGSSNQIRSTKIKGTGEIWGSNAYSPTISVDFLNERGGVPSIFTIFGVNFPTTSTRLR